MAEKIVKSVIVESDAACVFALWSDFELYPRFIQAFRSVTRTGPESIHWVMKGPHGRDLEWNSVVTGTEPGYKLAWKSTDGDLDSEGEVTVREVGPGLTELTVMMRYELPDETSGEGHLVNPEERLSEALVSFKEYVESGACRSF